MLPMVRSLVAFVEARQLIRSVRRRKLTSKSDAPPADVRPGSFRPGADCRERLLEGGLYKGSAEADVRCHLSSTPTSFDHSIGTLQYRTWDPQADGSCCFQVENKLDQRRQFDR